MTIPLSDIVPSLANAPPISSPSQAICDITKTVPTKTQNLSVIPTEPKVAKRPRSLAYPRPDTGGNKRIKLDTPAPGVSKQAMSKRKILEQIRNGTFIRNPKRWEIFKSKIAQLDPRYEVSETDPALARSAKHSRCGSWILMAAPYDVERFKAHVKSCSYSTGAGGMKTLEKFGVQVFQVVRPMEALPSSSPIPPAPSPRRVTLPCLGLTEKEDSRIKQYMMRTPVNSAGGRNIQDVATELFSDQFKNLSQKQKDAVRQKQAQTHIWSVDRMRKSVHAIGNNPCDGNARQGRDGTSKPCDQCQGLLSLRAFRNALNRRVPEDKNRAYVPHVFVG